MTLRERNLNTLKHHLGIKEVGVEYRSLKVSEGTSRHSYMLDDLGRIHISFYGYPKKLTYIYSIGHVDQDRLAEQLSYLSGNTNPQKYITNYMYSWMDRKLISIMVDNKERFSGENYKQALDAAKIVNVSPSSPKIVNNRLNVPNKRKASKNSKFKENILAIIIFSIIYLVPVFIAHQSHWFNRFILYPLFTFYMLGGIASFLSGDNKDDIMQGRDCDGYF